MRPSNRRETADPAKTNSDDLAELKQLDSENAKAHLELLELRSDRLENKINEDIAAQEKVLTQSVFSTIKLKVIHVSFDFDKEAFIKSEREAAATKKSELIKSEKGNRLKIARILGLETEQTDEAATLRPETTQRTQKKEPREKRPRTGEEVEELEKTLATQNQELDRMRNTLTARDQALERIGGTLATRNRHSEQILNSLAVQHQVLTKTQSELLSTQGEEVRQLKAREEFYATIAAGDRLARDRTRHQAKSIFKGQKRHDIPSRGKREQSTIDEGNNYVHSGKVEVDFAHFMVDGDGWGLHTDRYRDFKRMYTYSPHEYETLRSHSSKLFPLILDMHGTMYKCYWGEKEHFDKHMKKDGERWEELFRKCIETFETGRLEGSLPVQGEAFDDCPAIKMNFVNMEAIVKRVVQNERVQSCIPDAQRRPRS